MRLLMLLCLALWSLSARAFPDLMDERFKKDSTVCGGYEIFHINGILTPPSDAQLNVEALRSRYGNHYKEHVLMYAVAYNQTVDWDSDLLDSFKQVVASFPGTTMEQYQRAIFLGMYPSALLTSRIVAMLSTKWHKLFHLDRPSPYQDQDLTNIYNAIYGRHQQDARVLLVGHSQGTLYANLVYDRLLKPYPVPGMQIQAKGLSVLAIASVVPSASGGTRGTPGLHVTNSNDLVVNAVRLVSATTLASNTTVPINGLGHNLQAVYLNRPYLPTPTSNKIMTAMKTSLDALKSTKPEITDFYLRGDAQYVRCGPAAWPYGTGVEPITEIQCPIAPNGYTIYNEHDYVKYTKPNQVWVPGLDGYTYIIPGTPGQAPPYAIAFVEGCYKTYIADRKAQIAANVYPNPYGYQWKNLHSCGYGYPAGYPWGYSDWAWRLYSGDRLPYTKVTLAPDVKSDLYRADMIPLCKY